MCFSTFFSSQHTCKMLSFVGFPWRRVLWLLMEIIDLGNLGRHEGNVDDDPKQDADWLEFEVVSVEKPALDYQCRRVCTRRWIRLVCIITGPRHLEGYSFMLLIFFLSLGQSIGLALSRCWGNVCGMKEVSGVHLHWVHTGEADLEGGLVLKRPSWHTARDIGWKSLPYILPFYLKSPGVLRDSVAFLDRVSGWELEKQNVYCQYRADCGYRTDFL